MPASCACASFFGTPVRVTLVRETEHSHLGNGHAPRGKRLPSSQVLQPPCTELPMALMWRCALFLVASIPAENQTTGNGHSRICASRYSFFANAGHTAPPHIQDDLSPRRQGGDARQFRACKNLTKPYKTMEHPPRRCVPSLRQAGPAATVRGGIMNRKSTDSRTQGPAVGVPHRNASTSPQCTVPVDLKNSRRRARRQLDLPDCVNRCGFHCQSELPRQRA